MPLGSGVPERQLFSYLTSRKGTECNVALSSRKDGPLFPHSQGRYDLASPTYNHTRENSRRNTQRSLVFPSQFRLFSGPFFLEY